MKKSLLALAVLGTFAGAAAAQSSATVYGVADLSFSKTSGTSAQMSGNGILNNGNSRVGFKGTEDLGGGMNASFTIEQAVNLESGATEATTYQRAAWLQIGGGFGSLRMGRSLSPGFYSIASYELTGAANYSALANTFGFTGGSRENSAWTYTTPKLGDLSITVGAVLKGDTGTGNKTNLTATYAAGPLVVSGAYSKPSGGEKSLSFGGSFAIGSNLKLAASYQDPAGTTKGITIGGKYTMGQIGLTADLARDTGNKLTNFVFEGTYALSKRTFMYGAYYRADGAAPNTYGVGVRHNF